MGRILILLLLCCAISAQAQVSFSTLASQPNEEVVSIAVDPLNGDIYASSFIRIIKSANNGVTWSQVGNTNANGINVLYFTPAGQLYLGTVKTNGATPVGVESYNKATNTWTPVTGAPLNVSCFTTDNSGNLIAGTGSTGNFLPNPINYGTGLYSYNGTAWTAINTGITNLTGYSVLPAVKALVKTSTGTLLAATYGKGVLQYSGSTWSAYGTGLVDMDVSSLALSPAGTVYAGCDSSIVAGNGGAWSLLNTGLPKKPVRSLLIDGNGKLYAGLGYYAWMDGALIGDIYTSSNNGTSWQSSSTGFTASEVLCQACDAAGNIYTGASGIYQSTNSGTSWNYLPNAIMGAAQTFAVVKTSYGALFAISESNQPQYFGAGGVFRSLDGGATWSPAINGIRRHRGDMIFCDSHDHLWAGFSAFSGTASNGSHQHAVLYESVDTGNTWVQNTSILAPTLIFNSMVETPNGKLVISDGWGSPSNIATSTDQGASWNNNISTTGGDGFNLASNSAGDVFLGSEVKGLMRSTTNAAAGSFTSAGNNGARR